MIGTKHQTTEELIVQYLTLHPSVTFNAIASEENTRLTQPLTNRAWYKSLKRLKDDGVVVRIGKTYSLNNSWLQHIDEWLTRAKSVYLKQLPDYILRLPNEQTPIVRYRFTTLTSLNSFWAHALVSLAIRNRGEKLYCYNPHHWFFLIQLFEEQQFVQSLKFNKVKQILYIASRSSLDLWGEMYFDHSTVTHHYSNRALFHNPSHYLNVIGNYCLDINLSYKATKIIEQTFQIPKEQIPESLGMIRHRLEQPLPSILTISFDPTKIMKFSKKIGKYF